MTAVRAGDLNIAALEAVLNGAGPATEDRPVYLWLATPDEWCLGRWPGLDGAIEPYRSTGRPVPVGVKSCLQKSEWGCLFQPAWELRWRRLEPGDRSIFRVRVIADSVDAVPGEWLAQVPEELDVAGWMQGERRYRLWGENSSFTPEEWIELRIPHRFRYPVPIRRYVWLRATLLFDRAGQLQLVRWRELLSSANAEGE